MSNKRKPPARRAKPVIESPTYTTIELMLRYHVGRRTLRAWTKERGYPEGWKSGKHVVYLKASVHAWELLHMPHLHPVQPVLSAEDKQWDIERRRYLLDKEAASLRPTPRART